MAIGSCHSALQEHEQAFVAFGAMQMLDEHDVEAAYNCGNALLDLERYSEAITHFARAMLGGAILSALAKKNMKIAKRKLSLQ